MRWMMLVLLGAALPGCFFNTERIDVLACSEDTDCAPGSRCYDGICYEASVAPGCRVSEDCESGVCDIATGQCLAGSCGDQLQSGDETGIDCGGACNSCADSAGCAAAEDCESGVCVDEICQSPACNDGVLNGAESDVDCGAGLGCPTCEAGQRCDDDEQCNSFSCDESAGLCLEATCQDGILNGEETDLDCGGGCDLGCAPGSLCNTSEDCFYGVCGTGVCDFPKCDDGVTNDLETDVDCGGPLCDTCVVPSGCNQGSDCVTGVCEGERCVDASCTDTVLNGSETDVDCGGGGCKECVEGDSCVESSDCTTKACITGVCVPPGCTDTELNGGETDVDCGGPCAGCADGLLCTQPSDCLSGVCTGGTCTPPSCDDNVSNGFETGVDCGGAAAGGCSATCAVGDGCLDDVDCTEKVCGSSLVCAAPSCLDGVQNGSESDVDCGSSCGAGQGCRPGQMCGTDDDCEGTLFCNGSGRCQDHPPHCTWLLEDGVTTSGVYTLDPDGFRGSAAPFDAYCDQTTRGGGWTLVLKSIGNQDTFQYDQPIWTNRALLNPGSPDLDWTEAKLDAFNTVPVSEILVGLSGPLADQTRSNPPVIANTVTLLISSDSLHSVFNGNYRRGFKGRSTWKSLVAGSSLQDNCNVEGVNVRPSSGSSYRRVRLGIIGNEQDNCGTPDSFIGFGSGGSVNNTYVGNHARWFPDNGNQDIRTYGVVMVRSERRTCLDHLNQGETADGVYTIDPDGSSGSLSPISAQCDMTTDGGGWTLALNYLHAGGTNPELSVLQTSLPLQTSTALGDDGSQDAPSWGHAGNKLLSTFNVGESRWYGVTSGHNRVLHFKDVGFSFNRYIMTGRGCTDRVLFVLFGDHTALLPGTLDFSYCDEGEFAMTEFPFFHDASEHWGIRGEGNRWEVDDFPGGPANDTHHQVWVR